MKLPSLTKILILCAVIASSLLAPKQATASRDLLPDIKKVEGAQSYGFSGGSLRITGHINPSLYCTIDETPSLDERVLHIKFKTDNRLTAMKIWWSDGKRTFEYPNQHVPVKDSFGFHSYDIDLGVAGEWDGGIKNILIAFIGTNDDIEIAEMALITPKGLGARTELAAKTFMLPLPLTPTSINLVYSPFIFGMRLSSVVSIIFLVTALFFVALYLLKKKTAPYAAAIALLAAWMCYDLRDMLNQRFTYSSVNAVRSATGSNIAAFNADGFYDFADFVRANMPKNADGYALIPGGAYSFPVTMKYFLYPLKPYSGKPAKSSYNIIHEAPDLEFSGNTLYFKGRPAAKGNLVASLSKNTFIFEETAPEGSR